MQSGETALMNATCYREVETLKMLLSHPDIDVNLQKEVNEYAFLLWHSILK